MRPQVIHSSDVFQLDLADGSTITFPDDVVGAGLGDIHRNINDDDQARRFAEQVHAFLGVELADTNDPDAIRDCVDNQECGYIARLSMPGYMDTTDWVGPYDSAEEATEALHDLHGPDAEVADMGDDERQIWEQAYTDAEVEDANMGNRPESSGPSM